MFKRLDKRSHVHNRYFGEKKNGWLNNDFIVNASGDSRKSQADDPKPTTSRRGRSLSGISEVSIRLKQYKTISEILAIDITLTFVASVKSGEEGTVNKVQLPRDTDNAP